jgi:striatin 1/3/4
MTLALQGGSSQQGQSQTQQPSTAGGAQGTLGVPNQEQTNGPSEPTTAIFRPDDAGEWKEQLRLSHEASERARLAGQAAAGAAAWARDDEDGKEEEDAEEEENVGENEEETKVWKTRRTLRK